MKILVTGITGMLGNAVLEVGRRAGLDVQGTTRRDLNLLDAESIRRVGLLGCDVVVNCAGAIPQRKVSEIEMIQVNAIGPRLLDSCCGKYRTKLIQVSTDCVFSGRRPEPYSEADLPDPVDVYGMSKALGELFERGHLTIRTSIVGREIKEPKVGLLEWLLFSTGDVDGYVNHMWNGVTTVFLARVIYDLILNRPEETGLLHVFGDEMTKLTLLLEIQRVFGKIGVRVNPKIMLPTRRRILATRRMYSLQLRVPRIGKQLEELRRFYEDPVYRPDMAVR